MRRNALRLLRPTVLIAIGEDDGPSMLHGLLGRSGAPSLAHPVRSLVGIGRQAAQSAFARCIGDHSLTPAKIRYIELIIDRLTAHGVIPASAFYEPPFTDVPDAWFVWRENVIEGLFDTLRAVEPRVSHGSRGN